MKKRIFLALTLGLIVFGAVFAFAATLSIDSDNLGAGDDGVAACNPVSSTATVSYDVVYDGGAGDQWEVTAVDVAGLENACIDEHLSVVLTDAGGSQIGHTDATTVTANNMPDLPIVEADTSAEAVEGVELLITGDSD
jgi:hypothetical protein